MLARKTTDEAFARQVAQHVNGEDDVDVLICIRVIIMMVRDHQLRRINIISKHTVSQIAQLVRDVEWLLLAQMYAARRHERDARPLQVAVERRERDAFARECHGDQWLVVSS